MLRNALTPVISVIGLQISGLFGATVVVERVFNYPGLSTLLIDADTVLQWAKTMTWQGLPPIVQLATAAYERGKRIGKQAFAAFAKRLQRSQTLPRSSVVIEPLREGLAPSG